MPFETYLEVDMRALPSRAAGPEEGPASHLCLTASGHGIRLAELMLFDGSCLVEATADGERWRNLLSDRQSALARFRQRLPTVVAAIDWHPRAAALVAFADFVGSLEWPEMRVETREFRTGFTSSEMATAFDQRLEAALGALDRPALSIPGSVLGGRRCYTEEWENLLGFSLARPEAIYAGEPAALQTWPFGAPAFSNPPSEALALELFGRPYLDEVSGGAG